MTCQIKKTKKQKSLKKTSKNDLEYKKEIKKLRKIAHNLTFWKKQIINIVAERAGCSIQHNGCPCNTCFHSWACEELGDELGHNFWEIILVLRGDYSKEDIIKFRKE